VRLPHGEDFKVDGTNVPVPGFTMFPAKLAPFSCTVWNRFEYEVMFRLCAVTRVGSIAVPPGNVSVKFEPGATVSGAMTSIVTSCVWWTG
jgi:hypothetical protein